MLGAVLYLEWILRNFIYIFNDVRDDVKLFELVSRIDNCVQTHDFKLCHIVRIIGLYFL